MVCVVAAVRAGGEAAKAGVKKMFFITTFQYKMNENFKHLGERV